MLTAGAQVRHQFHIAARAFLRTEASEHLHLGLLIACVTFCLIVLERDAEVTDEQAYRIIVVAQTLYQLPLPPLPPPSPPPFLTFGSRSGGHSLYATSMIHLYSVTSEPGVRFLRFLLLLGVPCGRVILLTSEVRTHTFYHRPIFIDETTKTNSFIIGISRLK